MTTYTYTTLNDPLATGGTVASGINDSGQIAGYYYDNSGTHGFLDSGGSLHHAQRSPGPRRHRCLWHQ